jgi:hypothetical protein
LTSHLNRRLARLEAAQSPTERERFVWWDEGEPEPQTQHPGERLTIYRWAWASDAGHADEVAGVAPAPDDRRL